MTSPGMGGARVSCAYGLSMPFSPSGGEASSCARVAASKGKVNQSLTAEPPGTF